MRTVIPPNSVSTLSAVLNISYLSKDAFRAKVLSKLAEVVKTKLSCETFLKNCKLKL